MQRPDPIAPDIAEAAVHWLLELQEHADSAETVARWQQWRAADPEHERAWQHIEAVRGRFQALAVPPGEAAAVSLPPDAAVSAVREALLTRPGKARRRDAISKLAVLLLASGSAWLVHDSQPVRQYAAQWRSRRGERLERHLDDGSRLVVAGGSALNLRFTDHQRAVELVQGLLLVETAHHNGDMRSFFVETRDGRAIAHGTRYTVRLVEALQPGTQVAVYDGAVELIARNGERLLLQRGQQALLQRNGIGAAQPVDGDREAWAQGSLVARSMRLDVFVAELALHARYAIACAPDVAARRLSGSYPLDDIDRVLASVASLLDLRIERRHRLLGGPEVRLYAAGG